MLIAVTVAHLGLLLLKNANMIPTDQRGRTATGSGQNGNVAIAGTASEVFARWLCHPQDPGLQHLYRVRYARVELPSMGMFRRHPGNICSASPCPEKGEHPPPQTFGNCNRKPQFPLRAFSTTTVGLS